MSPAFAFALVLYVAPAFGVVIAWAFASWSRRWLAITAVAFVVAVSLPGWTTTPDGVLGDTINYAPAWVGETHGGWYSLFAGSQVQHAFGWNLMPVGLGKSLSGTWLAERAIGLGWHALTAAALCVLPITPLVSVPIVVAVTGATRFGLWLSRHHCGSEILLQQVLLIACLRRARRGSRWWAVGAAVLLTVLQYTYLAAHATLAYPVIILGLSWRAVAVSGAALLGWLPAILTTNAVDTWILGEYWTPHGTIDRIGPLIAAFWDGRYSQDAAWAWSYPGAQHLPVIVCTLLLLGLCCALASADGWRWIALAVIGLLPALLSNARLATSHREMMALVPLAVLAAWPLRLVPKQWAWLVSVGLAGVIVVFGLREWHDPAFWIYWSHGGQHQFRREAVPVGQRRGSGLVSALFPVPHQLPPHPACHVKGCSSRSGAPQGELRSLPGMHDQFPSLSAAAVTLPQPTAVSGAFAQSASETASSDGENSSDGMASKLPPGGAQRNQHRARLRV